MGRDNSPKQKEDEMSNPDGCVWLEAVSTITTSEGRTFYVVDAGDGRCGVVDNLCDDDVEEAWDSLDAFHLFAIQSCQEYTINTAPVTHDDEPVDLPDDTPDYHYTVVSMPSGLRVVRGMSD